MCFNLGLSTAEEIEASCSVAGEGMAAGDVPTGWELRESRSSSKAYYYNTFTGGTQWEKPIAPGPGQVRQLP